MCCNMIYCTNFVSIYLGRFYSWLGIRRQNVKRPNVEDPWLVTWSLITFPRIFYVNIHCNCRAHFGSIWTAVYLFWAHLFLMSKLGKPRKKKFVKVTIDVSCKYLSFLACQRSVKLLYEGLDTLIEALAAFTVRQP